MGLRDYRGDQEVLIAESAVTFAEGALQLRMSEGFFEDALNSGRCLVCLDALDEVPAEERFRIVRRVEQLARRYRNSHFVITSRSAGYDEGPLDGQTFARYIVQPMDYGDLLAFIDQRFAEEPGHAHRMKQFLNVNPGIKSLISNPLLMTILILAYRESDAGWSLNRAKFYERAVDILIRDEDGAGRQIHHDNLHMQENLLTDIALFFHNENRDTIGRAELEERASDFLLEYRGKSDNATRADEDEAFREAEAFIERAEQRTGLLVEQPPGSGIFGFVHTTFREYLTAMDIHSRHRNYRRHRDECWEEIKDRLTDARWREVILLLIGILDERYCTYLAEKILDDDDTAPSDMWRLTTRLELVVDALADQAPMSPKLRRSIVGQLESIGKRWHFGESGIGSDPIRALGAIKHLPEMVPAALTAIASDKVVPGSNRMSAMRALGSLGENDIAISFLTTIATDPALEVETRLHAVRELGDLRDQHSAIAGLVAIATDPTGEIGRLQDKSTTIPTLFGDGTDSQADLAVRRTAAQELGSFRVSDMPIVELIIRATDPGMAAKPQSTERMSLSG